MANPPDNNPGNNNSQTPKPGTGASGVDPQKTVQPGNQGSGGKPALTSGKPSGNQTRPDTSTTRPAVQRPAIQGASTSDSQGKPPTVPRTNTTPTGTTSTQVTPASGATRTSGTQVTPATGATTTGSPLPPPVPTSKPADSTTAKPPTSQSQQPPVQRPKSKLERPGTAASHTTTTTQQTRAAKPLTRPATASEVKTAQNAQVNPRPASAEPASAKPPSERAPVVTRPPVQREQTRPATDRDRNRRPRPRDNEPTRRMAPPPGARNERYTSPARRPARGGHTVAATAPRGRPPREGYRPPAYRTNKPGGRMAPPPGATRGRYIAPAARPVRRGHIVPPSAAAPAGSLWAPLLFGLLLLLGVLWYAIKHYAPAINADLTTRSNSALASAGYGSANVEIDGRNAILTGNVPTDADSQQAEEAVANTTGIRSVDNQLEIGGAATGADDSTAERTQPSLAFVASDEGVQLSGTVSDQEYADQIENSAKETYGENNVSGSINVDPDSTNPGWWPAMQELTPDLKNINGSFDVADGSVALTGEAPDEQTKNDLGAKAEELLDGQLTVDNRITVAEPAATPEPEPAPEPAPAPEPEPEPEPLKPAFLNYYNDGEVIQLSGYLPADSAATIADAFADNELAVINNVEISEEYEAPAWADNFAEATGAMQDIQTAEVEVQPDGDVVIYGVTTSEASKQAAGDAVASIYPDQSLNNQISVRVPEPEPIVPSIEPFASVTDDGTTITIAGLLPPATAEAIGNSFENSGRTVVNNVTGDERVIEPEWTDAFAATLQSMNSIENPKIVMSASGTLTISGLADNSDIRQQAANTSFDTFGNSVSLLNDITVKGPDISELLARIDLAAIRFRSGSSQLDADSVGILEQVADALGQVPEATVAISGHTDSTGSADRNLTLSSQRADRVRDFLIERGISGGRMTSQGFGSSQPIASNDTVTGRALNRRIDIALTN